MRRNQNILLDPGRGGEAGTRRALSLQLVLSSSRPTECCLFNPGVVVHDHSKVGGTTAMDAVDGNRVKKLR